MDTGWRLATEAEIRDLLALPGAPHVMFGCTCCGMVNWSAKNIALDSSGRYNGQRNIFVDDWRRGECECPSSHLRAVVREEKLAAA